MCVIVIGGFQLFSNYGENVVELGIGGGGVVVKMGCT